MRTLLPVLLLVGACGDVAVSTTSTDDPVATTSVAATSSTPTSAAAATTTTEAATAEDAAADFLVAVDTQLGETAYAGEAMNAPEVFLATGQFFCERLDGGDTVDELLSDYVAQLSGVPIADAPDDDLVLAGSVLGAAVANLCSEHVTTLSG